MGCREGAKPIHLNLGKLALVLQLLLELLHGHQRVVESDHLLTIGQGAKRYCTGVLTIANPNQRLLALLLRQEMLQEQGVVLILLFDCSESKKV